MSDVFSRFAPFIQDYIYRCKWEELREIQVLAAKAIFDTDENLLLSSGTASGKTEAAFLPVLTRLWENPSASVGVLYLSPPIRKAMPYLRNGEAIFSPRIFSPLSILPPSQPRRRSIAANSLASAFPSAASMTIITENRYSPAADVLSYKAPALTRVLVGFSLLILSPLLLTKYCVIFYTYEIL